MAADPREDRAFRAAFANALRQKFDERGIKVARAARQLSISRQAMYGYLNERYTPRKSTMAEAFWLWELEVEYRGKVFRKEAFPLRRGKAVRPEQLSIAEAVKALKPNQITTRIGPQRQGSLVLVVELKLAR